MSHYHAADHGTPLSALGYSEAERDTLRVARHFFHAFCEPEKQGWIAAFAHALNVRGAEAGPHFALATLNAIQAVRRVRHSAFRFNCPTCRECALYLSSNERTFMAALRAAQAGDVARLRAHAWLLCEANEAGVVVEAFRALAATIHDREPVTL